MRFRSVPRHLLAAASPATIARLIAYATLPMLIGAELAMAARLLLP